MYVNTTAEIKALTDYCVTSSNAVNVVRHILDDARRRTPRSSSAPTCSSAPTSRRSSGVKMHVWDGECHVHAGIRPSDIAATRAAHPGADFLIHPECGCSTSVMEYVAAGDVDAEGVHMLSTGGMLDFAEQAEPGSTVIMATEVGMLHPLRMAAPAGRLHRRQRARELPLHEDDHARRSCATRCARCATRSRCPRTIAERARVPIERMVAISA